jgi:hypothetical protein
MQWNGCSTAAAAAAAGGSWSGSGEQSFSRCDTTAGNSVQSLKLIAEWTIWRVFMNQFAEHSVRCVVVAGLHFYDVMLMHSGSVGWRCVGHRCNAASLRALPGWQQQKWHS